MNLDERMAELLRRARDAYPDEPVLAERLSRMAKPMRVAITGASGKSTVAKALAGQPFDIGFEPADADAVIHLMRHGPIVRSVDSLRNHGVIGVLARADEVGGGRIDAMTSAWQIARRYAADPRLREICWTVVPLAGMLALTARTLRQEEADAFADLASWPRAEIDARLVSADRLKPIAGGLLERCGLFGVRLGVALVRQGFSARDELAAELIRRSGLEELERQLRTHFCDRAQFWKAWSGMNFLDTFLRARDAPGLRADVERMMASAHEFVELRLLDAVRAGRIRLPSDVAGEAERLLGGEGAAIESRLGVRDDQRAVALRTLGQWRARAENPASSRQVVQAARVIVRTCEGLVLRLS